MSAIAPAGIPIMNAGKLVMVNTSEISSGDPAVFVIIQVAPMVCIHIPMSEKKAAIQSAVNAGYVNGCQKYEIVLVSVFEVEGLPEFSATSILLMSFRL